MGINYYEKRQKPTITYSCIVLGSLFLAISVNLIYGPKNMVTGGLSGLSIVIKDWTSRWLTRGVPLWLTTTICNIPLFFIAFRIKGGSFIKRSLFATICFILLLYWIPEVDVIEDDYLMAAICGGTVNGIGLGFVFMTSTSTGGTDLLSTILHKWFKNARIPHILLVIDGVIVILGAMTFGLRNALYSIVSVYLTSKVMDGILEGLKFAKLVFVISEQYENIASKIMGDINRGVTSLSVKGMYRKSDRCMLMCIVSKREVVRLVELASEIDQNAFIIVTDVREVMGEGFMEFRQ